MSDHLASIGYISIQDRNQRAIDGFVLDPDILLPIELDNGHWDRDSISWEAIISAMLKLLANKPNLEHAAYYRKFILAVKPEIEEEFTEAGILKARNKDYDLAIDIFKALRGLYPESAQVQLNLAVTYEDRARDYQRIEKFELHNEYAEYAFQAYKLALSLNPRLPETHFNFAHFFLDRQNFEKAKVHFQNFLQFGDQHSEKFAAVKSLCSEIDSLIENDVAFKEAFDFINVGQEKQGIKKIEFFLRLHPEVWNAWFLLGWGHRRLHHYTQAKVSFLKALDLHPDNPDTLNELAICHMELGEYEESRDRLEAALKLEPENSKFVSNLGILALKRGDRAEARAFFEAVLQQDEQDPFAARYLEQLR